MDMMWRKFVVTWICGFMGLLALAVRPAAADFKVGDDVEINFYADPGKAWDPPIHSPRENSDGARRRSEVSGPLR